MKNVFVVTLNDKLVAVCSSVERVIEQFKLMDVTSFEFEGEQFDTTEAGVKYLIEQGYTLTCFNDELIERGDDYCLVGVEETELLD